MRELAPPVAPEESAFCASTGCVDCPRAVKAPQARNNAKTAVAGKNQERHRPTHEDRFILSPYRERKNKTKSGVEHSTVRALDFIDDEKRAQLDVASPHRIVSALGKHNAIRSSLSKPARIRTAARFCHVSDL
jgi:hypothetical protein